MLRAGDVPECDAREDACMSRALGLSVGEIMPSSYAIRWDKRDEFTPSDRDDCEWIGEDAQGVWMRRNPVVALSMHPRLIGIMADWHAGACEMSRDDLRRMSAYEIDATSVMLAARARAEMRAAKQSREV